MIHALDLVHKQSKTAEPEPLLKRIPAIGVAFPDGDYKTTVSYVVNRVWLKQNEFDGFDDPDSEDDYDE